jgi:predicted MFS family arabinose efflux permease
MGLERSPVLSRSHLLIFAIAAGMSVANVYYAQPLLDSMALSIGLTKSSAGLLITVTQCGYALGLFFIVPLGDVFDRRRLVVCQMAGSATALAMAGLSRSSAMLLLSLFAVGILAVVVQILVAAAASFAPVERRGSAVGTVTSGVVLGILAARTISGLVSDLAGWRSVYLLSAFCMVLLASVMTRIMPKGQVNAPGSYIKLLASSVALYRTMPLLRLRAAIGFFIFAAFGTLWTSLVLPLSRSPYNLSRTSVGLFGLAGLAGAVAAGPAGKLADSGKSRFVTGVSLILLIVSWIPIGLLDRSFVLLIIGIVLLDFAVQAVHVTSQSMIFPANPEAKSRLVATYMLFYSCGSAIGAISATEVFAMSGWHGVCILGSIFSAGAFAMWIGFLKVERSPVTQP